MTTKKEFSAVDAAPVALYAKESADSQKTYPLIITSNGSLMISAGLDIPEYDFIALSYSGSSTNILTVRYYFGGSSGTLMATLSLTYTGSSIATVART